MKRIICSFMAVFLILLIPVNAYGNGDDWNRTIYISTPSIQEYIKDLTVKVYDGTKIEDEKLLYEGKTDQSGKIILPNGELPSKLLLEISRVNEENQLEKQYNLIASVGDRKTEIQRQIYWMPLVASTGEQVKQKANIKQRVSKNKTKTKLTDSPERIKQIWEAIPYNEADNNPDLFPIPNVEGEYLMPKDDSITEENTKISKPIAFYSYENGVYTKLEMFYHYVWKENEIIQRYIINSATGYQANGMDDTATALADLWKMDKKIALVSAGGRVYAKSPNHALMLENFVIYNDEGEQTYTTQEIANLPGVGLEYTQVDAYEEIPNSAKAAAKAK